MGLFGVSTIKRVAFRGGVQHFSNTYYYDAAVANTADNTLSTFIDDLVAKERQLLSADVTYTFARLWSAGGTRAENEMLVEKVLTSVGSQGPDPSLDRERCLLFQWRAGKDVLGRPVYLRKWIHPCGTIGGLAATDGQKAQTAKLTGTGFTQAQTYGQALTTITSSSLPFNLRSKTGRIPSDSGILYPWLEHHQLGEEWRG